MTVPRKPLRLLLVEDSPDDADLILFELNEGGFDVGSRRVDTEPDMREALKEGGWDVVISDFNLPRFGTRKALALLRETDAEIPFIIASGCIGEEIAIAMMKEGVSDFVMKDKLARLAPVVERELRDAIMRRERRQALEALNASEKLLNGITSSLGEGIFVMNAKGELVFMNPEAERLLGWAEAELLGKNIHGIIHGQNPDGTPLPESDCGVLSVLLSGRICKTENEVFMRKDGSIFPVTYVATAIMEGDKAVAAVAAFQDISLRKQAELNLRESRHQLQELSGHLQSVREEERARIARELHDELGQMLTGVKLDARWLASGLSGAQPIITDKIASMSKLIDETLDAMRRVAAELRPTMLDDLGLAAALEWLTEEFGKRTGISIIFEQDAGQLQHGCDGQCESCNMDAGVATSAFRIAQECLTNVARHSHALHVLVALKCRDGDLMLRVSDDGKGMDMSRDKKVDSFGIMGMRERVRHFGGTLNFTSAPGEGTRVELVMPIKRVDLSGAKQ